MKIVYLSRQFNRSGYEILEYLISNSPYKPYTILLPFDKEKLQLDDEFSLATETKKYMTEARHYGCKPIRFLKSIKLLANNAGIEVIYLKSLKTDESYQLVKSKSFDLMILGGGWPELIPEKLIKLPRLGAINAHPSLLPEFRGTDIHRWQVLLNVKKSGLTIHYVNENFDAGDILAQSTVKISSNDTPQKLFSKVTNNSGRLMDSVIKKIEESKPNKIRGISQSEKNVNSKDFHTWMWDDKDFLKIDWKTSAFRLWRLVLASTQESYKYNGPYFEINGHFYILRKASILKLEYPALNGEIFNSNGDVAIKCGNDAFALVLIQVQPINLSNWNNGFHLASGITANELLTKENMDFGDNILS
jgi:methionyl-tRNA formyltransferase